MKEQTKRLEELANVNEEQRRLGAEERRRLEVELAQALATASAAEQVPGLTDAELRGLEERVRGERERRQQLTLDREREAMRADSEMERERRAMRLAAEAERLCDVCLDADKDTTFGCGHRSRACAACAKELTTCHICRKPVTQRIKNF